MALYESRNKFPILDNIKGRNPFASNLRWSVSVRDHDAKVSCTGLTVFMGLVFNTTYLYTFSKKNSSAVQKSKMN